jgi:hypothetical protein
MLQPLLLALLGACTPADESTTELAPPTRSEPPVPAPLPVNPEELVRTVENVRSGPDSGPPQSALNQARARTPQTAAETQDAAFTALRQPQVRRFFQCAGDVTFAVRSSGARLEVWPPGYPTGYIALIAQPSETGAYYAAEGAEFRLNGELATLVLGRDRWVDCVSNPAAAVWQEPARPGAQ